MPFTSISYHYKKLLYRYGTYLVYFGLLAFVIWFLLTPPKCVFPKPYSLGNIDSRFDINDDELLSAVKKAEAIWEDGLGMNFFDFNPEEGLPVNLVYDERQQRTDDIRLVDDKLEELAQERQSIKNNYEELLSLYEKTVKAYEKAVSDYESDVTSYNESVKYWNNQYKVPNRTKEGLLNEQSELENKRESLEKQRIEINKMVDDLNSIASSDNSLVKTYNSIVGSFEERYGTATLFDRAVFTGESINVYEFNDKDALVLALAHELGHYAGINHLDNSKSIMYYLMQDQDIKSPKLSDEDREAILGICDSGDTKLNRIWLSIKSQIALLFGGSEE